MSAVDAAETFPQFVRAIAASYGERTALVLDDESMTYAELDERSAEVARGLLAHGMGKGTRIGVLHANGPAWAVAVTAITRIGAIAVPLSTFSKPPELARVIRHADLVGIVAQPRFLNQDFVAHLSNALPGLAESGPDLALPAAPYLRWIAMTSEDGPAWARATSWLTEAADDRFDGALLHAVEEEVHVDDVAVMIYTSGQSADPKGVLHAQGGVIGKVHYLTDMMGLQDGMVAEATMPFFWVGGFALNLLTVLEVGGTVVCSDGSTTMGTGMVIGALNRPTATPVASLAKARAGLGMSETFAMYSWGTDDPHPDHPLCVPLEIFETGYDVEVVDEGGAHVPEGGRGEIVLRGPSVTRGLQKVRRRDVFDQRGFYHTGDAAIFEGGRVYFQGRLGDMIKTSGANVAPPEVERELMGLGGIASAHVVAVPDDERGQVVGAAVVLEPGATTGAEELRAALRDRLSSYKVPRLVAFLRQDEVPLTPSRKIKKRELAALIRERAAQDR